MNPILAGFLFLFPLVMSVTWTVGGAARFLLSEVGKRAGRRPAAASLDIPVSLVIPCFNEARHLASTVGKALERKEATDDAAKPSASLAVKRKLSAPPGEGAVKVACSPVSLASVTAGPLNCCQR